MTHPLHTSSPPSPFVLQPVGSVVGAVDGIWWPGSHDLSHELRQVIGAVRERVSHLERVCYRYSNWDTAPRKVTIDGELVRLDGYLQQEPDTVRFVGTGGMLLVALIPPDTDPEVAHMATILAMAGAPSPPAHDLYAKATSAEAHQRHDAERAWEDEGGRAPTIRPMALAHAATADDARRER